MAKSTAEESRKISIFWLRKQDWLQGWRSGNIVWTSSYDGSESRIGLTIDTNDLKAHFEYTQTSWDGEKREMDYYHNLTTTPCNYGGVRYWFICGLSVNGRYCGRRVGVLYKSPGSWYWGCRHCHDLAYESQQESAMGWPFSVLLLDMKAEELESKIKRRTWAGRPTRKQRRLNNLLARFGRFSDFNN